MLKLVINNVNTRIEGKLDLNPITANEIHEALRDELSYTPPNVEWSPSFKEGKWDGKISLYYRRNQSFPTGLTSRVVRVLKEKDIPFTMEDTRVKPEQNYPISCDFGKKELRFYQTAAGDLAAKYQRGVIAAATGAGKTMLSCYMLSKMRICPIIFIVPAIELLRQTQREFEKYLHIDGKPIKIGMAGDGICDLNPFGINIITYQTALSAFDEKYQEKGNKIVQDDLSTRKTTEQLASEMEATKRVHDHVLKKLRATQNAYQKDLDNIGNQIAGLEPDSKEWKKLVAEELKIQKKIERETNSAVKKERDAYKKASKAYEDRIETLKVKEQIRNLFASAKGLIVDEAHVAAVVIEALGSHAPNAYYRIGLSATPWREDNQEIRIEGTLGKKFFEISASDLIELGYLVPPKIFMIRIGHVEFAEGYQDTYDKHITRCWERNWRIKQCAEAYKAAGKPVLILVERRDHGEILEGMIQDAVFVPGGDKGEDDPNDEERNYRRRMLNKVESNEIVLIATQWANVGVDAPAITVLILAGSGQSSVTTYQQAGRVLRCLGRDATESAENGKPEAIVIDFMDEQPVMRKHALRRKKVYKRERAFSCKLIS
jgi:superfamily II DNA or RNA helicase